MLGTYLLAVLAAMMSTSATFAQSSDDEVQELREEVRTLRALVERLLEAQAGQADKAGDQGVVEAGKEPDAVAPSALDAESQKQTGRTEISFLSSRQPLGRLPDDAFVTAGDFNGSVRIPGSAGSFRIGGMVQVNANYDVDNKGFQQIGTPPTIPLDGDTEDGEQQTAIHARLSLFNFDYRAPTKLGDFRIFIEFDMFGDGDQFTNDYDVRLRHAGVELGNWRFGQYHSGFVDTFAQPESADPGSPLAVPVLRQPGIYYMRGGHDASNYGFGIENPAFDFGGNTDFIRSESVPTFVAFGRLQREWGYLRVAGLGLQLRSKTEEIYTGGVHLSGRLNTPLTGDDDNLSFGIQIGEGFVHYYSSFIGGLDGVIGDDGDVEATGILGAFVGYQHWWTKRLRSTFMASFFELDSPDLAEPLSYSGGERYTANLFWSPIGAVSLGLEINYNTIETADGSEGEGLRIESVGRFFF
ncbi:MAG: DcaP family trimeric outer membrane transporter [Acidobacteriota bacterium]